jgi:competence protein ComEC
LRQPWQKTEPNVLQTELYKRLIASGLSGDELATIGALTLGYKEDLPPELRTHFQASGAAHVLAVSGLHTGIIYALVVGLLTLGGRLRPMHDNRWGRCALGTVIIGVMWAYAWLTGMTPSVVRAVLMVTIFEVGRMIYRQSFSLNTIAAAAVLILLAKPSDLLSVSFQLSFAATFMIVLVAREFELILHRKEWKETWYGRAWSWIVGTVIISLAAQLGTLAITMYYFHQISTYFLLANLMVLPIATLLVPCGLLSLALGGSVAGVWVSKLTGALAWAMNHSVAWIESLPGSTVHVTIGGEMVAVYYGIVLLFAFFFTKST